MPYHIRCAMIQWYSRTNGSRHYLMRHTSKEHDIAYREARHLTYLMAGWFPDDNVAGAALFYVICNNL